MSHKNPTVPLHVTRKELDQITRVLGYNSRLGTLGDKLIAAEKDMRVAVREGRRLAKQEKEEKNALCWQSETPETEA